MSSVEEALTAGQEHFKALITMALETGNFNGLFEFSFPSHLTVTENAELANRLLRWLRSHCEDRVLCVSRTAFVPEPRCEEPYEVMKVSIRQA